MKSVEILTHQKAPSLCQRTHILIYKFTAQNFVLHWTNRGTITHFFSSLPWIFQMSPWCWQSHRVVVGALFWRVAWALHRVANPVSSAITWRSSSNTIGSSSKQSVRILRWPFLPPWTPLENTRLGWKAVYNNATMQCSHPNFCLMGQSQPWKSKRREVLPN